jgi:hypothetical protein
MGDVADLQGQRGAGDGERRRILLLIRGDDGGDELDVVAEVLREERPHRPVDHPAGENGRLGGPALTARKAAGDATRGIQLLLVVAGEGKEVDAFTGCLAGHRGDEDDGVATADEESAVGLLGDVTGLDGEGLAGEVHLEGLRVWVGHEFSEWVGSPRAPAMSEVRLLEAGTGCRGFRATLLAAATAPERSPQRLTVPARLKGPIGVG